MSNLGLETIRLETPRIIRAHLYKRDGTRGTAQLHLARVFDFGENWSSATKKSSFPENRSGLLTRD